LADGHRTAHTSCDRRILALIYLVHIYQLVKEDIDAFSVLNNVKHKTFSRIGNKWVLNVSHPKDRWLSIGVQGEVVKLKTLVESGNAQLCRLRVRKVIKTLLDGRHHLEEQAVHNGCAADVDAENEGVGCKLSEAVLQEELKSTVIVLWPSVSINTFSTLVGESKVHCGHVSDVST